MDDEKKIGWFNVEMFVSPVWGMMWNGIWIFYETMLLVAHVVTNAGPYRILTDVIFILIFAIFYGIAVKKFIQAGKE